MEQLFIRLSTHPHEPVHWLIWSPSQAELIASGTLNELAELSQLSDHARSREVICFAPGTDVLLTTAQLPSSALRMLAQVIPNSLEDELAQDISELHFAWPTVKKSGDQVAVPVAVVAHQAMQTWLKALDDADIECDEIYPDVFMLPAGEPKSLVLGQVVVARTGDYQGYSTDLELLSMMGEAGEPVDLEMPLSIVAQAYNSGNQPPAINLRQQQYRPQRKKRKSGASATNFRPAWIAAAVLLVVAYTTQVVEWVQLGQQSQQLEQAIEQTYKSTFPNEKRLVNVRAQLNQHLASLGSGGADKTSMLQLMSALEPAFKANRDIRLEMVRYDNNTLRLQVKANSFASLENFRKVAQQSGQVTVEQGPVSNQAGAVSGALTVKKDS